MAVSGDPAGRPVCLALLNLKMVNAILAGDPGDRPYGFPRQASPGEKFLHMFAHVIHHIFCHDAGEGQRKEGLPGFFCEG